VFSMRILSCVISINSSELRVRSLSMTLFMKIFLVTRLFFSKSSVLCYDFKSLSSALR
jgi:hypothetical protein